MRSVVEYRIYILAFVCLCLCSLSAMAQDIRITRTADKSYPDQYMAKIEFISACDRTHTGQRVLFSAFPLCGNCD